MKNLNIHLTKKICQLYMRKKTQLLKEIEELCKWREVPYSWIGESISPSCQFFDAEHTFSQSLQHVISASAGMKLLPRGGRTATSSPWAPPRGPGGAQRPTWRGLSPGKGASCRVQFLRQAQPSSGDVNVDPKPRCRWERTTGLQGNPRHFPVRSEVSPAWACCCSDTPNSWP